MRKNRADGKIQRRRQIMKTILAAMLMMFLVVSSVKAGPVVAGANAFQSKFKAYITIGTNTVVLPSRVQPGDRITVSKINGVTLYERKVNEGAFSMNPTNLRSGLYVLNVIRNGGPIASVRLPLAE
jgi:hypothetical protein